MTEFQDIFADLLPATVFLYASAACLISCAVAALWMRGARSGESRFHSPYLRSWLALLAAVIFALTTTPSIAQPDPTSARMAAVGEQGSRPAPLSFFTYGPPIRSLWQAPAIRGFIGLSENSWDFSAPQTIPGFGPISAAEATVLLERMQRSAD
jgi:hypothetical protein